MKKEKKKENHKDYKSIGIEYIDDSCTQEMLKEFRKKVSYLMEKYKVFYITYSINPFNYKEVKNDNSNK